MSLGYLSLGSSRQLDEFVIAAAVSSRVSRLRRVRTAAREFGGVSAGNFVAGIFEEPLPPGGFRYPKIDSGRRAARRARLSSPNFAVRTCVSANYRFGRGRSNRRASSQHHPRISRRIARERTPTSAGINDHHYHQPPPGRTRVYWPVCRVNCRAK